MLTTRWASRHNGNVHRHNMFFLFVFAIEISSRESFHFLNCLPVTQVCRCMTVHIWFHTLVFFLPNCLNEATRTMKVFVSPRVCYKDDSLLWIYLLFSIVNHNGDTQKHGICRGVITAERLFLAKM